MGEGRVVGTGLIHLGQAPVSSPSPGMWSSTRSSPCTHTHTRAHTHAHSTRKGTHLLTHLHTSDRLLYEAFPVHVVLSFLAADLKLCTEAEKRTGCDCGTVCLFLENRTTNECKSTFLLEDTLMITKSDLDVYPEKDLVICPGSARDANLDR